MTRKHESPPILTDDEARDLLIEQIKAALPDCSISLLANIQKMAIGETSAMRSGLHYRIRRTEDD
jgi:hypothetical protein